MRTMIIALAALLLAGFAAPDDTAAVADRAVAIFHQRLDASQIATIQSEADQDQNIASARAGAMLTALHIRLGKVVSSKRTALAASGKALTLTYRTVFADGVATETFIYVVNGGRALLTSYEVDASDRIVTDFHDRLNARRFDEVVAMSGYDLVGKEDALRALLDRSLRKWGR